MNSNNSLSPRTRAICVVALLDTISQLRQEIAVKRNQIADLIEQRTELKVERDAALEAKKEGE